MWGDIAIAFLIAFLASFMATPHTINIANKLGAVDTPKEERRIWVLENYKYPGLGHYDGTAFGIFYHDLFLWGSVWWVRGF